MHDGSPARGRWRQCSRRDLCRICAADHRCSFTTDGQVSKCCNVFDAPGACGRGVDDVGEFALYFAEGQRSASFTPPPPDPVAPVASVERRDETYRALLAVCPLSDDHRHALLRRGLTAADLEREGYGSFPPASERRGVVRRLRASMGGTIANEVPGFDYSGTSGDSVRLLGNAGILIPVRDTDRKVVALKIRSDDPNAEKYLWFSSGSIDGPSSGAPCHVALAQGNSPVCRVTEGPMKANVAAALSGVTTLGISGATAARAAVEPLLALDARIVRLAWDADARKLPEQRAGEPPRRNHVAGGLEFAAHKFTELGFAIEVETWPHDPAAFEPKGIDDALLAGAAVTVHQGLDAWREIIAILRAAGREPQANTLAKLAPVAPVAPEREGESQAWTHLPAERCVIGSCLVHDRAVPLALALADAQDFSHPLFARAFAVIAQLSTEGVPVDVTTVAPRIAGKDVTRRLEELAQKHAREVDRCEAAARMVAARAVARRTVRALEEAAAKLRNETVDPIEAAASASAIVAGAASAKARDSARPFSDACEAAWEIVERALGGGPGSIRTGVPQWDRITSGLHQGQVCVLAAVTGGGKTALAQQVVEHVALAELDAATAAGVLPRRVLVFSREMQASELVLRAACGAIGVSSNVARSGKLTPHQRERLQVDLNRLSRLPVDVHDAARATVLDVRAETIRCASRGGCALVVVDYIQILDPVVRDPSEVRQITEISRGLKHGVATSLNVPVLALSQFTRAPAKGQRAPIAQDLRGSGSLENDADMIVFLHADAEEKDAHGAPKRVPMQELSLIVAKQRNGAPDNGRLVFDRDHVRFKSLEEMPRAHRAAHEEQPEEDFNA